MRQGFALLLLVLLALIAVGCGEKFDTYEDPTLEEIIDIGKDYLRAGDGGNAAEAFTAAVNLAPESSEAKYGLLIARNMQFISLIDQLVSFMGAGFYTVPTEQVLPDGRVVMAEVAPIGDYIQDFLAQSADLWYATCEDLYVDLLDDPQPEFEIDHFAMSLQGVITFEFGGTLDRSDLHFFGVLTSLVRFVVDFALAHNLNYDFFSMQFPTIDLNIDLSVINAETIEALIDALDPIFELLRDLLSFEDNPDFLTLKGDEGVERMKAAGIELGDLFWRIHLLIQTAYREEGEQPANSVHVIDSNLDGEPNALNEGLYIPGLGGLDADLVGGLDALGQLGAFACWDGTAYDSDPRHANPFYPAFATELLTALDVLPIVIGKDILGPILRALGLPPALLGDDFEIVISEIPYILPIDIGPWFAEPSPTGLKDLLWNIVNLWDFVAELLPDLLG